MMCFLMMTFLFKSFRFHGEPNELQTIQPKSEDVQMHNKLMRWSQYPFTTIQGMKRLSKVGWITHKQNKCKRRLFLSLLKMFLYVFVG